MLKMQATCDVCGTEKKESNHWILSREITVKASISDPMRETSTRLVFTGWNARDAMDENVAHLCGEGCAAKVLSRMVATWRGDPPCR